MNRERILETSTASLNGTRLFPEIVGILMEEGVESYRIDLVQSLKTYVMPNGECASEKFIFRGPEIAAEFSGEKVVQAIRASQAKQITYREFLARIMEAGVTSYTVYIQGKRAIYFGRLGDFHVEHFPRAV